MSSDWKSENSPKSSVVWSLRGLCPTSVDPTEITETSPQCFQFSFILCKAPNTLLATSSCVCKMHTSQEAAYAMSETSLC